MAYVFISHAVQADGEFAGRLARDLRARGVRVWIAPDSIPGGENWGKHINEALEACDTMIVVQTPDAFASKWVETETFVAIDRYHKGKMKIIPIDVKECAPPALLQAHQDVSFRQSGYEAALAQLLDRLGAPAEGTSQEPGFDWREMGRYALEGLDTTADAPPYATPDATPHATPLGSLMLPDWLRLSAPVNVTKPLLDPVWPAPEQVDRAELPSPEELVELVRDAAKAAPKQDVHRGTLNAGAKDAESRPGDESLSLGEVSLYGLAGRPRRGLHAAASAGDEAKETRDYVSAVRHYTTAIDSMDAEPSDESARRLLGSLHYRRGQCYERMDFIDSITAFDREKTATWQSAPGLTARQLAGFTRDSNKSAAKADYEKARSLGYWFAPSSGASKFQIKD